MRDPVHEPVHEPVLEKYFSSHLELSVTKLAPERSAESRGKRDSVHEPVLRR